jgi:hypothetical protein
MPSGHTQTSPVAQLRYDPVLAGRAHRALELAVARWREHAALPFDPPYDVSADLEAFIGPAQAYVVEVLAWMRGLDDYYLGNEEGLTARPGYEKARSQMTVLLHGARFAVNKSLHVLVTPVRMPAVQLRGVGTFGPPLQEPVIPPAIYLWPDLSDLPVDDKENPKQREAYGARYSHQPVGATIDELSAWFDTWKP